MTHPIVGLDIGRGYAIACIYDPSSPHANDLPQYVLKAKAHKIPATEAGVEKLLELGQTFGLEPTGKDHHYWIEQLQNRDKLVLICSGVRIRNHARERGILSKGDKEDALAIGSYCSHNLGSGNSKAFLEFDRIGLEIRSIRKMILTCQKQQTILINQLKARLAVEAPEHCKFTLTSRQWGKATCRKILDELAVDIRLSEYSTEDIELIQLLEKREARLEAKLSALIKPLQDYREVWEGWRFGDREIAAIVGALYPIDQFMCPSGAAQTHTRTKDGKRIKINHTLRGIQRCLGYGRTKIQSGDTWKWGRTGDASVRSSLYIYIDKRIVVARCPNRAALFKRLGKPNDWENWGKKKQTQWLEDHSFRNLCIEWEPRCEIVKPLTKNKQREGFLPWYDKALIEKLMQFNLIPRPIAQLQLYYEFANQGIGKHDRILKTLPFMIRLLARDLIQWHQEFRR